uniref:uncharacterized protein n=1 Tax=Myxine glutinosa TaxID=7769 RepID=UPI00358EB7B4
MERTAISLFFFVIALLCSGHLVLGSHFRGGTISWEYIGGNEVRFDYLVGWRRNSGPGGECEEPDVTSRTLLTTGIHWKCVQGCSSSALPKYRCIGYNKPSNWMIGSGTFNMNVTSVQTNVIEYTGCCYITTFVMTQPNTFSSMDGSWRLRTSIDISIRQDIGKPNSSPVTTSKPLIKVKSGCQTQIPLAVSDPDGDDVRCRLAVGLEECNEICGIVPYGSLNQATCILHFNPPRNIQGLWTLALTLEDFATVNGQRNGPFSSIPLQVIIEFQPNAACASPKFVGRTPNNNDKFNITIRQPFSFDIDIQSSSSSESIVSLSTISSESVTWQNITRNPFSSGVFHTSMTLTPQVNSEGEKQICFFATESSGQETELRCIIITIIQNCVPISYSYSPKDFNRDIITWSITFSKQFLPNSTSGYIRFWDTRSSRMIVKVAASSADIRGDLKTLAFGLSHRALPSGQPVHITVDDGVAESIGGLSCKGYNFTDQPFTIPRTPYAECHASADPHFKTFQNFHFSSNVTGTLLLAAHCPTGQPRTWEVFIYMETEPNSIVSSTTRADIMVYGKIVSFIHHKGTEVNGVLVQLPYYDPSGDFHILYEKFPVSVLHTKSYFTVKYNGWRRVQVELESEELYFGEMCGLCGSYDGTEGGNTRLPDGSVAPDLNTFFEAWED